MPPESSQPLTRHCDSQVEALWREIHRTNHRAVVAFGDCRMCEQDSKRLDVPLPKAEEA